MHLLGNTQFWFTTSQLPVEVHNLCTYSFFLRILTIEILTVDFLIFAAYFPGPLKIAYRKPGVVQVMLQKFDNLILPDIFSLELPLNSIDTEF